MSEQRDAEPSRRRSVPATRLIAILTTICLVYYVPVSSTRAHVDIALLSGVRSNLWSNKVPLRCLTAGAWLVHGEVTEGVELSDGPPD